MLALCRRIGSALGNDLGQMRVQFNAKDYAVQPAYRDDNIGLWQFEQERTEDGTQLETEGVRRVESDVPGADAARARRARSQPGARWFAARSERARFGLTPNGHRGKPVSDALCRVGLRDPA